MSPQDVCRISLDDADAARVVGQHGAELERGVVGNGAERGNPDGIRMWRKALLIDRSYPKAMRIRVETGHPVGSDAECGRAQLLEPALASIGMLDPVVGVPKGLPTYEGLAGARSADGEPIGRGHLPAGRGDIGACPGRGPVSAKLAGPNTKRIVSAGFQARPAKPTNAAGQGASTLVRAGAVFAHLKFELHLLAPGVNPLQHGYLAGRAWPQRGAEDPCLWVRRTKDVSAIASRDATDRIDRAKTAGHHGQGILQDGDRVPPFARVAVVVSASFTRSHAWYSAARAGARRSLLVRHPQRTH